MSEHVLYLISALVAFAGIGFICWGLLSQSPPQYEVRTSADVIAQNIHEGVTEMISIKGAQIRLKRDLEEPLKDLHYVDIVLPEIRNIKIKAKVLAYQDNLLNLRFEDLKGDSRSHILDWFESQNETSQ